MARGASMDPERWLRLEALFAAASALPREAQASYLDSACAGDLELRAEVESLLRHDNPSSEFLREPIAQAATPEDNADLFVGTRIGAYRILATLGEGGMGTVYLAERADEQYQAKVAVKVIRGGLGSADVVRRFRAERQILANLHHPNIAGLLDGGTTDTGLPYVVMEYVDGERIDSYCDRCGLTVRQRIELFLAVASAVQHAHRNLVVHRDLKPGNILVTREGIPKLLDFGIAKLLDPVAQSDEATTGLRPMTPTFASPEQVRGEPITTATDVYALGVILYLLLTGRLPYRFASDNPVDVAKTVLTSEPTLPSSAAPRVRRELAGDLDTILLAALRKEPARRYHSVEQLAEDLRRHLGGLPVRARKDTPGYRLAKFAQRHRVGVVGTGASLLVVAGLIGFYTFRLAGERDRARLEAAKATEVAGFITSIFEVSDPAQSRGRPVTAQELLDRGAARIDKELAGQPEVQATMLETIGQVYTRMGLYDRAGPLLERALAMRQRDRRSDWQATAGSLHALGILRYEAGLRDSALALLLRELALRRQHVRGDDPDIANALVLIASIQHDQSRFAAAESTIREALATRRRLFGEQHQGVAEGLDNLGLTLFERGHPQTAESLARASLSIRREVLGADHPDVVYALNNLAFQVEFRHDFVAAESLYRESIALGRRVLGDEHSWLEVPVSNFGRMLGKAGRYAEAESVLTDAVRRARAVGPDFPEIVYDLRLLGDLMLAKGDTAAAEPYYRQSVSEFDRIGSSAASPTAFRELAIVLRARGDYAGAEPLLRRWLRLAEGHLDPRLTRVAVAEATLGWALVELGRYGEAESLLVRSYEALADSLPATSPERRNAANALATLYRQTGREAEARALQQRLRQQGDTASPTRRK